MAGTLVGGKQSAATNKKRYGKHFYAKIGAKGGRASHTGGFYANRERARLAGAIGGMVSRRGMVRLGTKERNEIMRSTKFKMAYAHLLAVSERAQKTRQNVV